MAVRHDLGAKWESDRGAHLVRCARAAQLVEELAELEPPRARQAPLARIAGVSGPAGVLVRGPHVEDRKLRIVQAREELVACRERVEPRLQARLHRLELHSPDLELARPAGEAV